MEISTSVGYAAGYEGMANEIGELERAGLDQVWVAEAYTFDAVSVMGFIAGRTERVKIASGILNIYSRTPALLAMTAAGLDALSGGRFMLGLGASGPQVVEGFHGVPYDAPLTRMREIIDICRMVWKREEKLSYDGRKYKIPLPEEEGTGLGKPLKLINHPVREAVPIALATLGEKTVEMTAEKADAWLPIFFMAEHADKVWGDALKRGNAKRDPSMEPLQIFAGGTVGIGEGLEEQRNRARGGVALYVGGMGARDKNFYNQMFRKYGFEKEAEAIQDLFLSGRKDEAAAAVPQSYLDATSLIGPESFVRDRIQTLRDVGVTNLQVSFLGNTVKERVQQCDALRNIIEKS